LKRISDLGYKKALLCTPICLESISTGQAENKMIQVKEMCNAIGLSVNDFLKLAGMSRTYMYKIYHNNPKKFERLYLDVAGHASTRKAKAILAGAKDAVEAYKGAN
jgi:hypothetical protein